MAGDERAALAEPRLVKVRAGELGSGWAIGARGVLTARHVLRPFLDGRVDQCLAVPGPRPGAAGFDCTVVWQDPDRDIALLAVDEAQAARWAQAVGRGADPALADPGTGGLAAAAVGYPDATVDLDFTDPELVLGWLTPAGGAAFGRMAFDVDGGVPDSPVLWHGMSGAAVRDRPDGRLLGLVVSVDADRERRRLYVALLPDPSADASFAAALTAVGARPILEAANGPAARRLLAVRDQSGRPPAVREVAALDVFGVRKARTDIDTHGDPYYPYVGRQLDRDLAGALDRRASGTETRVLLLTGEAMSGKSRTGAQALRAHPVLSGWPLLVPRPGADLAEVVNLAPAGGAVLWLDDLAAFTAGLNSAAVRYWQTRPDVVVVATLRSDLLTGLTGNPGLRPAWALVADESLVEQFALPAQWSAADQRALAEAEARVRTKVAAGLSLGEVLAAAQELRERLAAGDPFKRALALTVIDWSRTGAGSRIPPPLAEELWAAYLPDKHAAVLGNKTADGRHDEFTRTVEWACEAIPGTAAALVTRDGDGLLAEDYLIAQRAAGRQEIAHRVWLAALERAGSGVPGGGRPSWHGRPAPDRAAVFAVARNSMAAEVLDVSREAWELLATGWKDEVLVASLALGLVRYDMGDLDGARAALRRAIESHDPDIMPAALNALGEQLREQGDSHGAQAAFRRVIDGGHRDEAPAAAFNLGVLLADNEDVAGATAAYRYAMSSGDPDIASSAAFNLAVLLADNGDEAGATAAYQIAIETGDFDLAPRAAGKLGLLLAERGDVAGAKEAFQLAIDSGHPYYAAGAASNLGVLLGREGDTAGAKAAYQIAINRGHPDHAPDAAFKLGTLLEDDGDTAGAKASYRIAIESGHPDQAPMATVRNAGLLIAEGDIRRATVAYQSVIGSGHPECGPVAACSLGMLLEQQGDKAGARAAYQIAIDSGHPEQGPAAAVKLGKLLAMDQDAPGAAAAYRQAIDSGHRDYGPRAAVDLGELLAEQGDVTGARAAYQQAIDSGDGEQGPRAALGLGILLASQGDATGAQRAYRQAIDSGHLDFGPRAAASLGMLLERQGDVAGAQTAYQRAIDSGHRDYGPTAGLLLARCLDRQGDAAGSQLALRGVVDSGHPDRAPGAAVGLGAKLAGQRDTGGARAAYQRAIDSGHPKYAPIAEVLLGEQCTGADTDARRRHREHAATSGDVDVLTSLAELYALDGDYDSARRVLGQAGRAGLAQADNYLALLDGRGGAPVRPSAVQAVSEAASAGDRDSMNFLGVYALSSGRRYEARSWWTQSAAAGDLIAPVLLARLDQSVP